MTVTSLSRKNLFDAIPADLAGRAELVDALARGTGVRVERIVSRGHASPPDFWYDQPETEWVLLVAGRARLRFDPGGVVELVPGDHITIPAHARHRVEWTDPEQDTVWVAVFLPVERETDGFDDREGPFPPEASA